MRTLRMGSAVLGVAVLLALTGCADDSTDKAQQTDGTSKSQQDDSGADQDDSAKANGTRENPYPIGTTIEGDEWDVTINSVILNATDAVTAENMFNDPPEDGKQYALVNITATYTGKNSSTPWVAVKYVGADGTTVASYDNLVVAPDSFDSLTELYTGGTASGNIVLAVPAEAPEAGVLSVEPDMFGDKSFVAVQ